MHVIMKLKWNWRDGNAASNEQRKSKGTFAVTSCHCHSEHTAHVNTSWVYEHGHTAHDNTDWVHYTCQQQLGKVQMSNASVNTAWANYMCKH
jgi:hypothetical protein